MMKSIRSYALVAVFALTASPMMYASRTGCDPHPQAVAAPSTFSIIVYTALSYLGL
jgi:hypothetical protein